MMHQVCTYFLEKSCGEMGLGQFSCDLAILMFQLVRFQEMLYIHTFNEKTRLKINYFQTCFLVIKEIAICNNVKNLCFIRKY